MSQQLDATQMLGALHAANPVSITSVSGVLTLTENVNDFIAEGTEDITSITGWTSGVARIRFNTARKIIYSTSLLLQDSADRTTAIGDVGFYLMTPDGAREICYFPAQSTDSTTNTNLADPLGVVKEYYGTTLPSRHVWAAGGTIGDADSGASELAGADAEDLFAVLWNVANTTNSQIKLYDASGNAASKGTDAATDFAAHMQISLPDKRGRVAIGVDSMGSGSADVVTNAKADVLGGYDGEETHTLSTSEIPNHAHNIWDRATSGISHDSSIETDLGVLSTKASASGSIGGDEAHNNMQPWVACNYIMRY